MNKLSPDVIARIAADDLAAARADAAERVKFQVSIADTTMKALILVNGGAVIALFTFLGNLIGRGGSASFDTAPIWSAFACFIGGLVAALLCHVAAFLSQDRFFNQAMHEVWRTQEAAFTGEPNEPTKAERRLNCQGGWFYIAGVLLAILSALAFSAGSWFALTGLLD